MSTTSIITTKTPGFAYVNATPALFCVPGDPVYPIISPKGIDTIVQWPRGSQLSYSIIPRKESKTPEFAIEIVKEAIHEWFRELGKTLELREARAGELADIRISFRTDMPSWSCIGAVAADSIPSQMEPTMNFNFGGWKSSKAVYSHASIKRLALHLFGHALGLPHAKLNQWPLSWKEVELERECDTFNAKLLRDAKGCDQLRDPESIMHYDVPARLVNSTTEIRQGNCFIDQEARSLVQSLYPKVLEAAFFQCDTSDFSKDSIAKHFFRTSCTANIVTGIRKVDMGINANFRLKSEVSNVNSVGYTVKMGTWDETCLNAAICNVLSFKPADERVQTGSARWDSLTGGNERWTRHTFRKAFNQTPNVVVFISAFDTEESKVVRIDVAPSDIDKNGFTVHLKTWNDSNIYNITASWVAHEPDEWSIRSGPLDIAFDQRQTKDVKLTSDYTFPMKEKPAQLFYAFSHIDVEPDRNLQVDLYATCDEKRVYAEFNTWDNEQGFFQCKGCYIALAQV
ncbi:ATP synthase subunits region orf 7 [Colletotrichum asianum]|uniref:ATP synthase subunits region orf 7 n=1 Tax=Colletotrichum asianum TaxID=702518 RepID=A0A8H3ZYS9_9PEZI|nr:ATP synthase subunits region orf 7 [Colletotrichum asianum]